MSPHVDGIREAFFGAAGSGKSYWAKRRIAERRAERVALGVKTREVYFDPQGEWHPRGETRVETDAELLSALRAQLYPVVLETIAIDDCTPLQSMPYLLINLDEAHNYLPAGLPTKSPWSRLLAETRKLGTDIFLETQRVKGTSKGVMTNATRIWIFPLPAGDRAELEADKGITLPSMDDWPKVVGPDGKHLGRAYQPIVYPDDFVGGKWVPCERN
jgi:hypothetical protein